MTGDDVVMESFFTKKRDVSEKETSIIRIVCRQCGVQGDHWTTKCPYKYKVESQLPSSQTEDPSLPHSSSSRHDKYVIPRNRDDHTIRVTNLSEETEKKEHF